MGFPTRKLAFTCWNEKMNCRSTNYGTRIDYIFIDSELHQTGLMIHCDIKPDVLGSDHCPVVADFDLQIIPWPMCPSYCTKNFPEFTGRQKKLSDFFSTNSSSDIPNNPKKQKLDTHLPKHSKVQHNDVLLMSSNDESGFDKPSTTIKPSQSSQKSITGYFSTKENSIGKSIVSASNQSGANVAKGKYNNFGCDDGEAMSENINENINKRLQSSKAWKSLMGCKVNKAPKIPLCDGHKEPCVLRTVKKDGKNQGKIFFACGRGVGRADNPDARCGYFEWQ